MPDTAVYQQYRRGESTSLKRFLASRAGSESLAAPLSPEDQQVQSVPEVSPTKWHLAHITWFYEEFVLQRFDPSYSRFRPRYGYLFNSYYEAVGPRHARPQRGLLSRPSADEILAYRRHVTDAVARVIERTNDPSLEALIDLGIAHEEQHQELILMDIKHVLSMNPLLPAYRTLYEAPPAAPQPLRWHEFGGGLHPVGHDGAGFAFDNEGPRHRVWLEPFRLAHRLVTCGEYLGFIREGGYRNPAHWLSDGWATVQSEAWQAPLYWHEDAGDWQIFTLGGARPLRADEPVCHVSFYEAAAYASWAGHRLATEAEWEIAAAGIDPCGNFIDSDALHPLPALAGDGLQQMFGDLWEWTASAYAPYPGYRAPPGAIGEYNGKFMSNQIVLRGGAAVTPAHHIRATYRNFFWPAARWPFTGIRLAEDIR